jgi:hypothetical protein
MMARMETKISGRELEKIKTHIVVEIIEYVPRSALSRTIFKKATSDLTITAYVEEKKVTKETSAFNKYIQIIDGAAEVVIDDKIVKLGLGEGMIIPAHTSHCFNAGSEFKMISTIIKSGYED